VGVETPRIVPLLKKRPRKKSQSRHLLYRIELGHQNSFPKLANFRSYFTQLYDFPVGATFEKHADPEKKNRNIQKSRANSRNLLEPFLRSRKEENLYVHCAMNYARDGQFQTFRFKLGFDPNSGEHEQEQQTLESLQETKMDNVLRGTGYF